MLWLVIKSLISGVLVGIVSEAAKRSAAMGALVASLPIVSVLGMVWLWQETKDTNRLADHAEVSRLLGAHSPHLGDGEGGDMLEWLPRPVARRPEHEELGGTWSGLG